MRNKYNFVDITVYAKTAKGQYENITDFALRERSPKECLPSDSDYLIEFCTFDKSDRYIAEVSLDELLCLAGISDASFIRRFGDGVDNGDELLAVLCAKKIVNYDYGRIVRKEQDGYSYLFKRQSYTKDSEKKKRIFPTVLEKTFVKA